MKLREIHRMLETLTNQMYSKAIFTLVFIPLVISSLTSANGTECRLIDKARSEGFDSVKVDEICLWRKFDRMEGITTWRHPSHWLVEPFKFVEDKIFASKPIIPTIKNDGIGATLQFTLVTTDSMKYDSDVKIWYTGLEKGIVLIEGEFISLPGTDISVKFIFPNDFQLNLLKNLAKAEEALIRFRFEDIELSKEVKDSLKDMIYIWENQKNQLK